MKSAVASLASLALGLTIYAAPAQAIINAPVPAANYITFGGNDWAWASPCPPSGSGPDGTVCGTGESVDFTYQGTQGWRLPTAAELLAGPSVADFGPSNAFACASAWFTNYSHCDYADAQGGAIFGAPGGGNWYDETWVIRAVPEPASWAMMITGFGLIGAGMRRQRTGVTFG